VYLGGSRIVVCIVFVDVELVYYVFVFVDEVVIVKDVLVFVVGEFVYDCYVVEWWYDEDVFLGEVV